MTNSNAHAYEDAQRPCSRFLAICLRLTARMKTAIYRPMSRVDGSSMLGNAKRVLHRMLTFGS